MPANPFAYNRNGIALAIDGSLSYNCTVADMIDLYIDHRKKTNTLNQVNNQDFYYYIEKLYYSYFVSKSRNGEDYNTISNYISRVLNDKVQERGQQLTEDETQRIIENYRQVIGLIVKAGKPEFTYSDYLRHYSDNNQEVYYSERTVIETNRMLIEAFEAMTQRFGNPDGYNNVRSFFYNGQENLITRNNNLRARMVNSPFRENLRLILNKRQMDFDTYAKMVLNQYHIDLAEIARMRGK